MSCLPGSSVLFRPVWLQLVNTVVHTIVWDDQHNGHFSTLPAMQIKSQTLYLTEGWAPGPSHGRPATDFQFCLLWQPIIISSSAYCDNLCYAHSFAPGHDISQSIMKDRISFRERKSNRRPYRQTHRSSEEVNINLDVMHRYSNITTLMLYG